MLSRDGNDPAVIVQADTKEVFAHIFSVLYYTRQTEGVSFPSQWQGSLDFWRTGLPWLSLAGTFCIVMKWTLFCRVTERLEGISGVDRKLN